MINDKCLQVEPVHKFHNECSIFYTPIVRKIVVGIHNKQVGHRPETVLQTRIDIHIFGLCIVLNEGGKEQFFGKEISTLGPISDKDALL